MKYCSAEDIKNEFKEIDFEADDSSVKIDSVNSFIEQSSAEMNSIISTQYLTPVTKGPDALLYLKQICIMLVAQRVKDIVEVKNVRNEGDQDVRIDSAARARKMLKDIANNEVPLIGADLAAPSAGVSSFVSANNVPRIFKKNVEQW